MLNLEDIQAGQGSFALRANFSIPAGTRVAIIGPSGAGKSTLLSAIAGFLTLEAGRILWQGRDISMLAPSDRPVTLLFQDNNLFPHLTLFDNLGLGLRPNLRLTPDEKTRIAQVLAETGLDGFENRKPAALSGGQQSRAALARALLRDRPILMLDEPFAALGPALRHEMLDLVARILDQTGATLLMVTHDPDDARRIADQTILVAEGRAFPPAPTEEMLRTPPPALAAYLGK